MDFVHSATKPSVLTDELEKSQIQNYFENSTIFVTGATGFLGSLLVEKLLRSCPKVNKIYILMRSKKGVSSEERFLDYFQKPIFEEVLKKCSKVKEKVVILLGDCTLPELGLSNDDRQIIIEEVNSIIHLAATVRFDEKLKTAAYINVRATQDILKMAKEAKNLSSVIYVSTALSNCPNKNIEEIFYKPPMNANELVSMVDLLEESLLDKLTPAIIGKWPNTYTFTKLVAEDVVKTEGIGLPIAICRPSIVIATANEPIPGWIDNYYGATGIIAGLGIGLIRTLYCKRNDVVQMVPADYVINNIISAAWSVAQTKTPNSGTIELPTEDIPIYNYVSGSQNPITYGETIGLGLHYGARTPSVMAIWHPFLFFIPNRYLQLVFYYLLHIIPAHLIDFLAFCFRKKTGLRNTQEKVTKLLTTVEYFTSQEWKIDNKNTQSLWIKLNKRDKELFQFNIESISWESFFRSYIRGIRLYIIKDPLETLPQGIAKYRRIKIIHYFFLTVITLCFIQFILWIFNVGF